jgi:hypothetical protein
MDRNKTMISIMAPTTYMFTTCYFIFLLLHSILTFAKQDNLYRLSQTKPEMLVHRYKEFQDLLYQVIYCQFPSQEG